MKLLLKEFQIRAVADLVAKLRMASKGVRDNELQSVCLASPTGSGKTVIVTAAIEQILQGDDESAPVPDAVFLWLTDMPELNEQTRRKMATASSELTEDALVVIDKDFDRDGNEDGPELDLTPGALDKTNDPVRMYLREMGSVELLSREGEIAIAKRIEAGREAMIAGLCESPLTFQAIIIWRDELNDAKILLRDIIDLSENERLSRTIITGVTAILALSGLAIFGGEALHGFSIALIFGIVILAMTHYQHSKSHLMAEQSTLEIERRNLRALTIDGKAPTLANLENGSYPYARELYLVF
mgnify:CR=1 FL=1